MISSYLFRYVGVFNGLPKTAYIKMIDVWFIFCMVIPFLEVSHLGRTIDIIIVFICEVILQTYIESLRAKIGVTISVNHHGNVKTINNDIIVKKLKTKRPTVRTAWMDKLFLDERSQIEMMINITQFIIPMLAIFFIGIYFFCGMYFVFLDPKYNF